MQRTNSRSALLFTLCLLAILSVPSLAQPHRYTIIDLGILPGKTNTWAFGNHILSKGGQVAGYSNNGDFLDFHSDSSAVLWSRQQGLQGLPGLPGATASIAWTQNERGQVVGQAGTSVQDFHAVIWENGTVRDLGVLPGDNYSRPLWINNRGQIVGWSASVIDESGTWQRTTPVLWDNGQLISLPTSTFGGAAMTINDRGQIAGVSLTADPNNPFQALPVLWDRNGVQVLGTLGGDWAHPNALNNRGQIGGWGQNVLGEVHAFFWENGIMTDLGDLGGGYSAAWDINEKGQLVGEALTMDGELHAMLFDNGQVIDLNGLLPVDSGWVLLTALGINEHGQIAGGGIHNGEFRLFLLTPRK